ncbi:alpha/beta hydrolase [Streptomyces sp. NBC_01142]|uniref:alpha/beta fold hydrolase n=1 Tax=Streptomyces sp. NBC_01142 TaxID=2975865 RepID=UPI0022563EEC|nr:alpha/beta hydrolase [Streptomyces sp. NBC_01142]MCX4825536.1 alpha/beta hydrolase [Streptomyces sp. NBC_01142]
MRKYLPVFAIASASAAAIALPGCAGPLDTSTAADRTPVPAAKEFSGQFNVGGGRKIYLHCKGSGSPTVILESGIHDSSDTWNVTDTQPPVPKSPAVFPGVATFTRVCEYDRPGTIRYSQPPELTTRSTPVTGARSLTGMVGDLNTLLTSAKVPGPYLLVGHSFGGMITRLYAQTHPGQTAGLVFVDSFGTNMKPFFGKGWTAYLELLNQPGTALDTQRGFETIDVDGAIEAIARARPVPEVPLAVLSKTKPFALPPGLPKSLVTSLERAWPKTQQELVNLEPQTPHFLATGSDHYVQIRDPDLTISAVRLIVGRANNGS